MSLSFFISSIKNNGILDFSIILLFQLLSNFEFYYKFLFNMIFLGFLQNSKVAILKYSSFKSLFSILLNIILILLSYTRLSYSLYVSLLIYTNLSFLFIYNFSFLTIGSSVTLSFYIEKFIFYINNTDIYSHYITSFMYFTIQLIIIYHTINESISITTNKKKYVSLILKYTLLFIGIFQCICLLMRHDYLIKIFISFISSIFSNSTIKYLFLFWIVSIMICIYFTLIFTGRQIIRRKLFHFLILFIFSTGFYFIQTDFILSISILVTFLFILVEIMRKIYLFQKILSPISDYLIYNIDSRDSTCFILSHIFLLFGCYSSYLLYYINTSSNDLLKFTIMKYISLIVLGVGDAFASIIGSKYGRRNIFSNSNKTYEGTISGFITSFLLIILLILYSQVEISMIHIFKFSFCLILTFIYEAFTLQMDNLFLPLFTYELLTLIL